MTGLLLLDVDGPLNPYAARAARRPEGYVTYRGTPSGGWQWRGVTEFAAGRPLAWFDDEHDEHAGAAEFAAHRAGTPTLLCHVDPAQGLGSAHLAAVREWAG